MPLRFFWASWRCYKTFFDSLQSWWDRGKEKVTVIAIKLCDRKSKDSKQCRSLLVNLADHLKSKIDLGMVSLLEVYKSVLSHIAEIDLLAASGAQVRSRIHWAEEGETSSRYFFRLEKKQGAENWIPAMKNSDGSIASSIVEICDSWVSFYSSLFTACDTDPVFQDALLDQLSSSLPPDQVGSCDGYISSLRLSLLCPGWPCLSHRVPMVSQLSSILLFGMS